MDMDTNKKKKSGRTRTKPEDPVVADRDKRLDGSDVCQKAPEWAEHQRLWDDDLPCDDGRSGRMDKG